MTDTNTDTTVHDTYALGDLTVRRMGYGAMQLAGPQVFGPPADRDAAIAVLREAVALGVDHIDTSDFYGPYVTNQIIKEALHPYPEGLRIVTKVGARRDAEGAWLPAASADELRAAVDSNLENLGIERLDVVNLRVMDDVDPHGENGVARSYAVLAELQEQGLIRHLGISGASAEQIAMAQDVAPVVGVQNLYNLANRTDDDLIDSLAEQGIAYVPFFPLGGYTQLQSAALDTVADRLGAGRMSVALAWLLQRSPNILLIPGTSSIEHLRDNIAGAALELGPDDLAELDAIGR